MLFVPADRPDRWGKALASGADLVCIDLEDAVRPEAKAQARQAVLDGLRGEALTRVALRINGLRTADGLRDVLALVDAGVALHAIVLPKTESPSDVELVHEWLGQALGHLVALVETPRAVEHLDAIGAARHRGAPRLGALMLGGADLSTELGAKFEWDSLAHARGRLLNAARAHGLKAWDVPFVDVADEAGLIDETRRVRALGFDCKAAIHPAQLAGIHAAFKPDPQELAWAQALLAEMTRHAGGESTRGAFVFQGRMVDAPILARARRLLALERMAVAGQAA